MVSVGIVSRYSEGPTPAEGGGRKIFGGPLYPVDDVLGVLTSAEKQSLRIWTRNGLRDIQALNLDERSLRELLRLAVNHGRFIGAEWCAQQENGP